MNDTDKGAVYAAAACYQRTDGKCVILLGQSFSREAALAAITLVVEPGWAFLGLTEHALEIEATAPTSEESSHE